MKQSFIVRVNTNDGCVNRSYLRTSDGVEWCLVGEWRTNGMNIFLSREYEATHENRLYFAELKIFLSQKKLCLIRAPPYGMKYSAQTVVRTFTDMEKRNEKGFTFLIKRDEYKIYQRYPEALQITLQVMSDDSSEPEPAQIQVTALNKKMTNFDKLSASMGQIFRNETMADVVLTTDSCAIKAHKLILAAQSPVFQKMFSTAMKEALNNEVKISDINDDVLKTMLSYMYTSEITFKDMKTTRELYVAADRYDVKDLKDICSTWLNCMTVDSAVDTLVLADDHSDQSLKSAALEFIASNYASIKKSIAWQSLLKERLALAIEFLSYKVDLLEG